MRILDWIANTHNWIADRDFVWWPFSFLRPDKKTPMTLKHVFQMTLAFGGLAFVMFSGLAFANNALNFKFASSVFFTSFLGFFIWFSLITKPLWNRRALK